MQKVITPLGCSVGLQVVKDNEKILVRSSEKNKNKGTGLSKTENGIHVIFNFFIIFIIY